MERDFTNVDEDGIPICIGEYMEEHPKCDICPIETKDKCMDEQVLEEKRDPDILNNEGEPECFGKYYSDYSRKCNKLCDSAIMCSKLSKDVKLHLPVVNNKPCGSVRDPYSQTKEAPKVDQFKYTPEKTYSYSGYSSGYNSGYSYSMGSIPGRPNMSPEAIEHFYGVRPHPNPIVPGQFEGEDWYVRLMKEFVLRTFQHGVQVMGSLLIEMISKVRWAPKTED